MITAMSKIGWGQLGIVLALSRIFSEAANFPSHDINYGMQRFTVIIASYLLLAAALIPVFVTVKQGFGGEIYSTGTGKAAAILLILYLTAASVITITRLQFYASSTIFDAAPPWVLVLFVALVCLYGLFKGLAGIVRTGVIVAAVFILLLITVIIGVSKDITPRYLYPAIIDNTQAFFGEVMSEFSKNAESAIFAALFMNVRKNSARSLYISIGLSAAVMLLMTFLYNTVLGEYLNVTNFPFYMLSALSDISVLQRLDGIDVTVWVMSAVIKVSLLVISVFSLAINAFGSKKAAYALSLSSLGISAAASLFFSVNTSNFLSFAAIMETGIPFLAVIFPLPLIILLLNKKRRTV